MSYIIIGAGAVGGSMGACLFAGGFDVTLVARGEHLAAIREHGLRFEHPDGVETHHIPVVERAADAEITTEDVILVAVKSQDTASVLASLEGVAHQSTPVFCLQNGVENERVTLRRYANVYGGVVIVPATYLSPGTVAAAAAPTFGICDVGRYPSGSDAMVNEFAQALNASRWSSVVHDDIMDWKYAKLLDNLSNAVQIAIGLEHRDSDVAKIARAEGEAVLGNHSAVWGRFDHLGGASQVA